MNKKNKKILVIFLFLIICVIILVVFNKKESFEEKIVYVEKTKRSVNDIFTPIFRILLKNYKLKDSCLSPFIIVTSFDEFPKPNTPYIFYDGESSQTNIASYHKSNNDPLCIGCFMTNLVVKSEKTYYLPLFLDRLKEQVINQSPINRLFTNSKRDKLAVYIAHHSPSHRDKFFKILHSMDKTVEALGKANNTRKVDLPSGYLSLGIVYKEYKFVFAMENKNDYGYITEKIGNAFTSGAIPIYWGTSFVKEIFNIESFVYVNDYKNFEECAKDIISISNDPIRYEQMRNAPIFNTNSQYQFNKYYDYSNPPKYVSNIASELSNRLIALKKIGSINI